MAQDTRAAFLAELEKVSPSIARAFAEAIADLRSVAQERLLIAAIERRDVEGIIKILSLGPEFFSPLDAAISEAFVAGGVYQLSLLPLMYPGGSGERLIVRFDARHERAEQFTRMRAAELITDISEDVRDSVRQTLIHGAEHSTPPRALARQIVGQQVDGRMQGGIIGLTRQQTSYVLNARDELSDPATMHLYFERKRRDKRFDGVVRRAMKAGKPLLGPDLEQIIRRYSERLLKLRGETIARTEALRALNAGKHEGILQLVEKGKVPIEAVKAQWKATPSDRTRDTHMAMNGQIQSLGLPFQSPRGSFMAYPGDSDLGAPASETINCRCSVHYLIDWVAVAQWRRRMAA